MYNIFLFFPVERPDTVMWKHGPVVLTVGHLIVRKDLRISVVNGTSLFVNGTDTRYAGNYSCEVDWSVAEPPASVTHYLEVQVGRDENEKITRYNADRLYGPRF